MRRLALLACVLGSLAACARSPAGSDGPSASPARSTAASSASSGAAPCLPPESVTRRPCASGARQLDPIDAGGGRSLALTHCPAGDCGSGGCAYEVFGASGGCLQPLGSFHAAWIDVLGPDGAAWPPLRTWGRSGVTHYATEWAFEGGKFVEKRKFACDYGGRAPMPPECPRL
jgi:hypothetical protein